MENMMNKLRNLDAYPKINEDFYSRTLSGGVITLASSIVMLLLFLSELRTFLSFSNACPMVLYDICVCFMQFLFLIWSACYEFVSSMKIC